MHINKLKNKKIVKDHRSVFNELKQIVEDSRIPMRRQSYSEHEHKDIDHTEDDTEDDTDYPDTDDPREEEDTDDEDTDHKEPEPFLASSLRKQEAPKSSNLIVYLLLLLFLVIIYYTDIVYYENPLEEIINKCIKFITLIKYYLMTTISLLPELSNDGGGFCCIFNENYHVYTYNEEICDFIYKILS